MTEVVRLTLVSHAMTDAMTAARFPADEPLSDVGIRQAEAVALDIRGAAWHLSAPEQRTRQTAQLLGLSATAETRLADLDCGQWRGKGLADIDPVDLQVWLTDAAQVPHGGESIVDLMDRVAEWLASLTDKAQRTVAVTHPAVIRAAILVVLESAPNSFWRIDVAPVSRTVLHFRAGSWTLRWQTP